MRRIFSETGSRAKWRKIWLSLAEAQADYGLVTEKELASLRSKVTEDNIDLKRAHEIERKIKHDLMAEVKTYAEQAPVGGAKLHLGATSMEIEDNADILKLTSALNVILSGLTECLDSASKNALKYKATVCMGWTHLQPAEPTTLGYRFANYLQDLVSDVKLVEMLLTEFVKGKGIKGAVGTSASFERLMQGRGAPKELEEKVMRELGLDYFPISTQTYPRKVDYLVLSTLASIAQSASKFCFDLRIMQSPGFGEMSEPIGRDQVGSSAMPFKRNPTVAERVCSLARYVGVLPLVAFSNASNMLLERTLDDSANRRLILPQGFLAVDEILTLYNRILKGLRVYPQMIKRNLERYGPFAGTEALLMKLVQEGEDRQEMHELIRRHSFKAWENVMEDEVNPLERLLAKDPVIKRIGRDDLRRLLDPSRHVGDAEQRVESFVGKVVRPIITRHKRRRGLKGNNAKVK